MSRWGVIKSLFRESLGKSVRHRKVWGMLIINQMLFLIVVALFWSTVCLAEVDCTAIREMKHFYQTGEFSLQLRILHAAWTFCSILFWLLAGVMLYSEIIRVWNGQTAQWKRGWKYAAGNTLSVFLWAMLTFAVTTVIGWCGENAGVAGRMVSDTAQIVWSVLMIMIIPVLARETGNRNPFDNLLQAVRLLRLVWVEVFAGAAGIVILMYLVFSLELGIAAPWIEFARKHADLPCWTKVAGFGAGGVLFWLGCTYVYIVYAYYLCGTYLLASEGVPPSTDDCDNLL